jgi:hypothetical protein
VTGWNEGAATVVGWHRLAVLQAGCTVRAMSDAPTTPDPLDPDAPVDPDADPDDTDPTA